MHRIFLLGLSFDLESGKHVIFNILFGCSPLILISPPNKVLLNIFLHIDHVETRTADSDGRKLNLSDWFGRVLQGGNHLINIHEIQRIIPFILKA